MTFQEFNELAKTFNKIAITKTILADSETPLSVYRKLANLPNSFLLESVEGGEKWGRYSIIGLPAKKYITVTQKADTYQIDIVENNLVQEHLLTNSPLEFIEQLRSEIKLYSSDKNMPEFNGGLVGFFSYDVARINNNKLNNKNQKDTINTPDIILLVCEQMVVFDNLAGTITIVLISDCDDDEKQNLLNYTAANQEISSILKKLEQEFASNILDVSNKYDIELPKTFNLSLDEKQFKDSVIKIKDYIKEGDCMQVVISERFDLPFSHNPLDLYRVLRSINPSPYLYYFHFNDFFIVGSSPEVLMKIDDRKLTVRPIAGTRKRGKTPEEDLYLEQDLLSDAKELSEHFMLIDLGRNDVARVTKAGTVKVVEKAIIEKYFNVMHIVSEVTGELKEDVCWIDALQSILPAGTLSGAPKIRAMQIIDEIEQEKRGIYGGSIGYLSFDGNLNTAIAIRTAIIKNGRIYVQAGAGIVADSIPENEWNEVLNKRLAMFSAIAILDNQ